MYGKVAVTVLNMKKDGIDLQSFKHYNIICWNKKF